MNSKSNTMGSESPSKNGQKRPDIRRGTGANPKIAKWKKTRIKKYVIRLPEYEHKLKAVVINPRPCEVCGKTFKPQSADCVDDVTCEECK